MIIEILGNSVLCNMGSGNSLVQMLLKDVTELKALQHVHQQVVKKRKKETLAVNVRH